MHQTIYHGDPFNKKFFFSTDHCQEFDDEDDFIPVSSFDSVEEIRGRMISIGYEEISNPDPNYQPELEEVKEEV